MSPDVPPSTAGSCASCARRSGPTSASARRVAVPLIFVTAVALRAAAPTTWPSAATSTTPASAIPLVLLLFGSVWMFPLITALVAGDIVAAEDHNGTLKTILTRSLERGQIFAGKALADGDLRGRRDLPDGRRGRRRRAASCPGFNPLVSLSGKTSRRSSALGLVGASLLVYLMPIFAMACIGLLLSTITRNSAAAVVGNADVLADRAADRDRPRPRGAAPVPAQHAVRRLAGAPAHADRLGPDRARGLGLRALRNSARSRPHISYSCGGMSQAADQAALFAQDKGQRAD